MTTSLLVVLTLLSIIGGGMLGTALGYSDKPGLGFIGFFIVVAVQIIIAFI